MEQNEPPSRDGFAEALSGKFETQDSRLHRMVWEHVRDSPDACPFCDWRTYAPVALAGMAREPLLHLISLASGNSPAAAHTVVLLARQLTKFLAEETERNLDLYRGIAEREFAWPMLVARKNEHNDSVNALREKLNLGAKGFDPRQVRGRVRELVCSP